MPRTNDPKIHGGEGPTTPILRRGSPQPNAVTVSTQNRSSTNPVRSRHVSGRPICPTVRDHYHVEACGQRLTLRIAPAIAG
jgi:hypothetical protein